MDGVKKNYGIYHGLRVCENHPVVMLPNENLDVDYNMIQNTEI